MFRIALAAALATAALLASIGVLYSAAEQRRVNCVREGNVGCGVLPWTGEKPPPVPNAGTSCALPPDVCRALRRSAD